MNMKATGLALAVLALTVTASAQSADKAQIKQIYSKLATAMKARDMNVIEGLEAPNYTEHANGKNLSRKEANDAMAQEFQVVKTVSKMDIQVLTVSINGKTAHVTAKYSMAATLVQAGKSHILKAEGKTSDTLVKTSKGWLFAAETDEQATGTLDGKPMKM
jgi:ketosteroid isomerase-like protein